MSCSIRTALRPKIQDVMYCTNFTLTRKKMKYDSQAAQATRFFQFNSHSNIFYFYPRESRNHKPVSAITTYLKSQVRKRGSSTAEYPQTDFGSLDVLGNTPAPSTSIDACLWDGFHLNNGVKITHGMGVLLVAGEAFGWQPWVARRDRMSKLLNVKGQWEVEDDAWGVLALIWPKPDLLILGLGRQMRPLSPKTSSKIHDLGIRIEIQDTRNAAAQYNLLATERGLNNVAAALIPIGWNEEASLR